VDNGDLFDGAGVIPRSVCQIFDKLQAHNQEFNLKVTFLELYNEEITRQIFDTLEAHNQEFNIKVTFIELTIRNST
jgi:hypothetical protein